MHQWYIVWPNALHFALYATVIFLCDQLFIMAASCLEADIYVTGNQVQQPDASVQWLGHHDYEKELQECQPYVVWY